MHFELCTLNLYNDLVFNLAKHRVGFFFGIILFVAIGTILAILFTRGYRIDFGTKTLKPTGLLVISSNPAGAEVFVDGKLKMATNNSLSLEPREYEVEVIKNGFLAWKKKLLVERELVTSADVFLFPSVPDLKPITFDEAASPKLSPDGTRVVYSVPLPEKNSLQNTAGLWVMDLVDFPFNLGRGPRQVAKSIIGVRDFSKANYDWSLNGQQIIVEIANSTFLLDPNSLNNTFTDVSKSITTIKASWEQEKKQKEEMQFRNVPAKMKKILEANTKEINFSSDGTKIVYQATASAEIPDNLVPPVLAASTQRESRKIESGKTYVYDIKEDKNFFIPFEAPKPTPTPKLNKKVTPIPSLITDLPRRQAGHWSLITIRWFPTSRHLYWIDPPAGGDKVVACEYDGTNLTTIYSGPFIKPFVFAAPSGNRLIILTKIDLEPGKDSKPNLFEVSLR